MIDASEIRLERCELTKDVTASGQARVRRIGGSVAGPTHRSDGAVVEDE